MENWTDISEPQVTPNGPINSIFHLFIHGFKIRKAFFPIQTEVTD